MLRFLRVVNVNDIERTLDSKEDAKIFEAASEKLRVALREEPEPGKQ